MNFKTFSEVLKIANKGVSNLKALFLLSLACLLIIFIYSFSFSGFFVLSDFFSSHGLDGREVLLQQTNYEELLKAGRELISKAVPEISPDKPAAVRDFKLVIPKDVNMPDIILQLKQKTSGLFFGRNMNIRINSENLYILFTIPHESDAFGVIILPEDSNEIPAGYRVKELIPGLWYTDERYNDNHYGPDYNKYVEKMIKRNKYLKKK